MEWLYSKGWLVKEAAIEIGKEPSHVSRVLKGERKSPRIIEALEKLPVKTINRKKKVRPCQSVKPSHETCSTL